MRLLSILGLIFCASQMCLGLAGEPATYPRISDLVGGFAFSLLTEFTDGARLSPDGRLVAYTLQNLRTIKGGSEAPFQVGGTPEYADSSGVWLSDIRSGTAQSLTRMSGSDISWFPVWSPEGNLGFYRANSGTGRIWLWDRRVRRLRQLSSASLPLNADQLLWTRDGHSVIAELNPLSNHFRRLTSTSRLRRGSVYVYTSPERQTAQSGYAGIVAGTLTFDIGVIDTRTGHVRRIVKSTTGYLCCVSHSGRYVLLIKLLGSLPTSPDTILSKIVVIRISDGDEVLEEGAIPLATQADIHAAWAPRDDTFAYTSSLFPTSKGATPERFAACTMVSVANRRRVVSRNPGAVSFENDAPVWSPDGRYVLLSQQDAIYAVSRSGQVRQLAQGHAPRTLLEILTRASDGLAWSIKGDDSVYLHTVNQQNMDEGIARIRLMGGTVSQIYEAPAHLSNSNLEGIIFDASRDGSVVSLIKQDAEHEPEVFVGRRGFEHLVQVTDRNPSLDRVDFGSVKLISWLGRDRTLLRGSLLLPREASRTHRVPLVVWQYPGDFGSRYVHAFGLLSDDAVELHILTTHGYAVFFPDFPLTIPMSAPNFFAVIEPGIDAAFRTGVIDPQRVGLMGWSFGGYSTMALIEQTRLFKAAVAVSGISDELSIYSSMWPNGVAYHLASTEFLNGGTPWNALDRYTANSPIYGVEHIATPLLLIHGAQDYDVPLSQSEAMFVSLRRLGKSAKFVVYYNEGHTNAGFSFADQVDYWTHVVNWFDSHLKP